MGELAEKIDPTLVKTYSINELSTQIIFAAANGDMLELRRYFVKVFESVKMYPSALQHLFLSR